jgi:hypothetical protein
MPVARCLVEDKAMARCENCGNEYDKIFEVVMNGVTHTFDCFECAIEKLAPRCGQCGTRIIGHGVEAGEAMYCSAHCTKAAGAGEAADRV